MLTWFDNCPQTTDDHRSDKQFVCVRTRLFSKYNNVFILDLQCIAFARIKYRFPYLFETEMDVQSTI